AASIDRPRNITPSNDPMTTRVLRAFFHAGGLNAGTPLEIASTPVTAAPPDPNALSTTKTVAPRSSPLPGGGPRPGMPATPGGGPCGSEDVTPRTMPTPIRMNMLTMKKYVGTANIFPDSFVPRRLP